MIIKLKNSQNTKKLNNSGFTLIELMIVIVIIGLLTSIALPAYQNYINRAKITEGFQLATQQQAILSEWMNLHGSIDENPFEPESQLNINHGKYVKNINISPNGEILVLFNKNSGNLENKGFILKPEFSEDKNIIIQWSCEPDSPDNQDFINPLLPSSCKKKQIN